MHAPKLTASMQQIGHSFAVHFEGSAQPRGEAVVTAHCGLSERWPSPPDGIGQRQSDLNFFKVVPTEAAGKRSLAEAGPLPEGECEVLPSSEMPQEANRSSFFLVSEELAKAILWSPSQPHGELGVNGWPSIGISGAGRFPPTSSPAISRGFFCGQQPLDPLEPQTRYYKSPSHTRLLVRSKPAGRHCDRDIARIESPDIPQPASRGCQRDDGNSR